jgi:hypothetical protein
MTPTTPGQHYRLTARLLDATYAGSNHVRAGRDINLDEYGTVHAAATELVFTATTSETHITCNNVAATPGEFALFDDIVLVEMDGS